MLKLMLYVKFRAIKIQSIKQNILYGFDCHPYPNVFVLGVRLLAVFSNINKLTVPS